MIVQQNKNNYPRDINAVIKAITFAYYAQGYCFDNPSFDDLENWVGKEAIDYVKQHLHNRCEEVLSGD